MELIAIKPAPASSPKKYQAIFRRIDGKEIKTLFGARGYSDYLQHKDPERRKRYLARHQKDLRTKDPTRAGYLSYYILWGPTTSLQKNIQLFRKKFFKTQK